MILYKPGTQFLYKGRLVRVDFVILRKMGLLIRLKGQDDLCKPEDLTPVTPANLAASQAEGAFSHNHR
jgi:hypothetical protein